MSTTTATNTQTFTNGSPVAAAQNTQAFKTEVGTNAETWKPTSSYIEEALAHAKFEEFKDGTIYGSIPGFQGVWANGKTRKESEQELREVLSEWLILRKRNGLPIPTPTLGEQVSSS